MGQIRVQPRWGWLVVAMVIIGVNLAAVRVALQPKGDWIPGRPASIGIDYHRGERDTPVDCRDRRLFDRSPLGRGLGDQYPRVGFISRRSPLKVVRPGSLRGSTPDPLDQIRFAFEAGVTLSTVTETSMLITFKCENCGKEFHVDERSRGKRGRCSHCGHVMRIPSTAAADPATAGVSATTEIEPAAAPEPAPFRLSPPEPRPMVRAEVPAHAHAPAPAVQQPDGPHGSVFALASPLQGKQQHMAEHDVKFELLDDDADRAVLVPVSPEVERGLREIAEFEKDRSGYKVGGERSGFFSRLEKSRPAGWFYVKWRACVGSVLKLLRWVDTWAYLISVPFLMLMIFGIIVVNRGFVHTGAVVVVLTNYGRFWADLIAFFLRPYKDGPLQGVAFLFPPYTFYYLTRHWDRMKPIVRRMATSCIPIVLVVLAYAYIPPVDPEVAKVQGVRAKIKAAKQELDMDIDSELTKVESEIRSLATPKETAPQPKP